MNRIRLLAIGAMLTFSLSIGAQSTAASADHNSNQADVHAIVPTPESQFKLLNTRLELRADQQAALKPILKDLYDESVKLVDNRELTQEQRMNQVRSLRWNTDRKIREFLTDDQQKKLDQLEHEPHPEMHGGLNGGLNGSGHAAPQQHN